MALVNGAELSRMAAPVGHGYRVLEPGPASQQAALRGYVGLVELRPGLFLHYTDMESLHDMTAQVVLTERVVVVLALQGRTDASFGENDVCIEPRGRGAAEGMAEGVMVSLAEPVLFTRRTRRGTRERKVVISVTPDWLATSGLSGLCEHRPLLEFSRSHLATVRWHPSRKSVALAEQILNPPRHAPFLQRLYLEGRTLDILTEAFSCLLGQHRERDATELRPRDDRRMRELREFLDSRSDHDLSLDALAAHIGTNPNTLQRNFRAAFGMTVFEYLRERRLQKAREALEQDGVTVARAAEIAGYTSAANFSTAYRRRFGLTPRQSKSWV